MLNYKIGAVNEKFDNPYSFSSNPLVTITRLADSLSPLQGEDDAK